jgi:hypothetical protein
MIANHKDLSSLTGNKIISIAVYDMSSLFVIEYSNINISPVIVWFSDSFFFYSNIVVTAIKSIIKMS